MFSSTEACQKRTKIADRAEFNRVFDVTTDRSAMTQNIRSHFAASPPARPSPPARRSSNTNVDSHPFASLRCSLANPIYQKIDVESVVNTFTYMFDRHSQGIYVSIRNSTVVRFSSFRNKSYRNPLGSTMRLSADHDGAQGLSRNPQFWSNFDCLVMGVAPSNNIKINDGYEPGYNYTETRTFVDLVCKTRVIADCDFFFNLWDQLLLRKDMCAPHLSITGGKKVPIPEYQGKRMCPIVSFCGADDYLDLPFIFPDDVQRVMRTYFLPRCTNPYVNDGAYVTDWARKKPTAVFRGSATGCGWTVETNPRLAIVHASANAPAKYEGFLDAALTGSHDARFKKHNADTTVRFFTDHRVVPHLQSEKNRLSLVQQSEYKYVLDIPGNVVAYRLPGMFGLGSVVMIVEHERYRPWIHPLLKSRSNCLVLKSPDLVMDAIQWCRENDASCKAIARRGLQLFKRAFCEEAMIDYVALLCNSIAYNSDSVVDKLRHTQTS